MMRYKKIIGKNSRKRIGMRNICMISQSPYPFDPRVRRQAEKLTSAGFEVDVICMPHENEPEVEDFGNGVTAYRVIRKNPGKESMVKYLLISARFFFLSFIKLQKLNRKRKYMMIQVHNMPDSHVFIALLQKIKGTPVILDIHDLTPELLTSKWDNNLSRKVKPLIAFVEKISCKFSNHVITVTEGCREILISRSAPPEKITLILNTANTSIFPFYKEREFRKIESNAKLLYHGTVAERFGLHIIIDAMPLILKTIPGSILLVHGKYDADYKDYLIKKITGLNLEYNVVLGDARTHEELYDIMKETDIEVVPYLSNEYMNLSLSTKAFECAAAGLPIVATRLRTLNMAFNDNAVAYAEDQNIEDFAGKIIELCHNPEKRKQMTLNAYNAVLEISGDVMEERYLSLIEKITGVKRKENNEPDVLIHDHNSKN
jgi:glycosyltransferase involved in cell wall biosynthesis